MVQFFQENSRDVNMDACKFPWNDRQKSEPDEVLWFVLSCFPSKNFDRIHEPSDPKYPHSKIGPIFQILGHLPIKSQNLAMNNILNLGSSVSNFIPKPFRGTSMGSIQNFPRARIFYIFVQNENIQIWNPAVFFVKLSLLVTFRVKIVCLWSSYKNIRKNPQKECASFIFSAIFVLDVHSIIVCHKMVNLILYFVPTLGDISVTNRDIAALNVHF